MEKSSTHFIHLSDRNSIREKLAVLTIDTPALFGRMTAQHMLEHLSLVLMFSNGKKPIELAYSSEKADKIKAFTIDSDNAIPIGFRSPVLPEDPLPLIHPNLMHAKESFLSELDAFEEYFKLHPDALPVNPTMGNLSYDQWIIFHNKHIVHHFKQFGLI